MWVCSGASSVGNRLRLRRQACCRDGLSLDAFTVVISLPQSTRLLDILEKYSYKIAMKKKAKGRPKKDAKDRKTADLRIPVTQQQKDFVYGAVGESGFASWARALLLDAAEVQSGKPRPS